MLNSTYHQTDSISNKLSSLEQWQKAINLETGQVNINLIFHFNDETLDLLHSPNFTDEIKRLINVEQQDLAPSNVLDYGPWRSTRNNATYYEYVRARAGHSNILDKLNLALDTLNFLNKFKADLCNIFISLDGFMQARNLFRQIKNLATSIHSQDTSTVRTNKLNLRDIQLCATWAGQISKGNKNIFLNTNLSKLLGEYDSCRLMSARTAELAVADYYRCLNQNVTDISVTQLDCSSDQWKDYDLLVNGRPIDVKNARRSFSSPETYVEHCVPRFKIERVSKLEVSIAGVLSDYADEIKLQSGNAKCQILGEINVSIIRSLYVWMRQRFGAMLNLDGLWKQGYLPGWCFEYPKEHYQYRTTAIANLKSKMSLLLAQFKTPKDFPAEDIPGFLLTLCNDINLIDNFALPELKKTILADLYSLNKNVGFLRPTLFIYSMGFLLESMNKGLEPNYIISTLKDLLFYPTQPMLPLWLLDTQRYVFGLIELTSRVYEESIRKNLKFHCFKMPNPSILRGQLDDFSWITLIAYCGGWVHMSDRSHKIKCGASPLFFGKNVVCQKCGYLICDQCGYCSGGCNQ